VLSSMRIICPTRVSRRDWINAVDQIQMCIALLIVLHSLVTPVLCVTCKLSATLITKQVTSPRYALNGSYQQSIQLQSIHHRQLFLMSPEWSKLWILLFVILQYKISTNWTCTYFTFDTCSQQQSRHTTDQHDTQSSNCQYIKIPKKLQQVL